MRFKKLSALAVVLLGAGGAWTAPGDDEGAAAAEQPVLICFNFKGAPTSGPARRGGSHRSAASGHRRPRRCPAGA